jgi:hypothetical protein
VTLTAMRAHDCVCSRWSPHNACVAARRLVNGATHQACTVVVAKTRVALNVSFAFRIVRIERVPNVPKIGSYAYRATLAKTQLWHNLALPGAAVHMAVAVPQVPLPCSAVCHMCHLYLPELLGSPGSQAAVATACSASEGVVTAQ